MAAVGGGDQRRGGLVFLLRPGTYLELRWNRGQNRWRNLRMPSYIEIHEDPRMAAESLLHEGT